MILVVKSFLLLGLFKFLGCVSIPSAIWEKPKSLNEASLEDNFELKT
jgi:hypothetical protein